MTLALLRRIGIPALIISALALPGVAQFNGRPGDVVIYTVTYGGAADFQAPGVAATNTQANIASFHKVDSTTLPVQSADPFPLQRQVLFTNANETFQIGVDVETTLGLHRLFVFPTKLIVMQGDNLPGPGTLGQQNQFISWPKGIDVCCDIALESLKVATWFPGPWPFIVLTDHRGSLGPPDISGFQYLFSLPDAVKLPAVIPWTNMSLLYPTQGWKPGIDLKPIENDTNVGSVIREMRLRPGAKSPVFRVAGHTHMIVLSGSVTVTPAGGNPIVMNANDYVYLPENFAVTLSNPAQYTGPVTK